MKLTLIRHGKTTGNTEGRFSGGRTDDRLTEEGRSALCSVVMGATDGCATDTAGSDYLPAIYVSPMTRAKETAEIMFPGSGQIVIEELREIDFGIFEGHNHEELDGDPEYQAWIDSWCRDQIPEGEGLESFRDRTMMGLAKVIRHHASSARDSRTGCNKDRAATAGAYESENVYIVSHGGTIMAIMSSLTGEDYFDFNPDNGTGYTIDLEVDDAGNIIAAGAYDRFCGGIRSGSCDR